MTFPRFARWQPVLLLSLYACHDGEDPPDRTVAVVTDSTGTHCDIHECEIIPDECVP